MTRPSPVPLRPGFSGRPSPATSLVRALVASARHTIAPGRSVDEMAAACWPADQTVPMILRSATGPATTSTSGWAAELVQTTTADLITTLGPTSAGSELLSRSVVLTFGRSGSLFVPSLVASGSDVSFVQEGSPVPIRQLLFDGPVLTPKKLGVGFALTREIADASVPSAERLVRAALSEAVGLALDAALFDATEGTDVRPGGLRFGVNATAATAGGGENAMTGDLAALAAAIAPIAGKQIAYIASPAEAVKISLRAPRRLPFPVLSSSSLSGVVMAVATNSLVAAVDDQPRFHVAREATFHEEDTSPAAISTAGTPNVVSAPVRNYSKRIRLTFNASWGLRAAGSVAWVENVTW